MRPKRAQSFQDEETSFSDLTCITAEDQNKTAKRDVLKSKDCEKLSDRFRERRRPKYLSDYILNYTKK